MSNLLYEEGDYKLYNNVAIINGKKYSFLYVRRARRFGQDVFEIGLGGNREYVKVNNFIQDMNAVFNPQKDEEKKKDDTEPDIKDDEELKTGSFMYNGVNLRGEIRDGQNYILRVSPEQPGDKNYPPGLLKTYNIRQNPEFVYNDFLNFIDNAPKPDTLKFYTIEEEINMPKNPYFSNTNFVMQFRLTSSASAQPEASQTSSGVNDKNPLLEMTSYITILAGKVRDDEEFKGYKIKDGKLMITEEKKVPVPDDIVIVDDTHFRSDKLKEEFDKSLAKLESAFNPEKKVNCNLGVMKQLNRSLLTNKNNGLKKTIFVNSSKMMGIGILLVIFSI